MNATFTLYVHIPLLSPNVHIPLLSPNISYLIIYGRYFQQFVRFVYFSIMSCTCITIHQHGELDVHDEVYNI